MTVTAEKEATFSPEEIKRMKHFYLKPPYVYLINPEMVGTSLKILKTLPLGELLKDFYKNMLEEGMDFKILGIAVHSAVKLHRHKINILIEYEQRKKREFELKRQKRMFQFEKPLKYYWKRGQLQIPMDIPTHEVFFEELLNALKKEEKKRELSKKAKRERQSRRRRRVLANDIENLLETGWNYEIDLKRIEIEQIVEETYQVMKELLKHRDEISFTEVISQLTDNTTNVELRRLSRVRTLLSLLYLIKEEKIVAFQDLDTLEIYIQLKKKNGGE